MGIDRELWLEDRFYLQAKIKCLTDLKNELSEKINLEKLEKERVVNGQVGQVLTIFLEKVRQLWSVICLRPFP